MRTLKEHGYVGFDHKGQRHEIEAKTPYDAEEMIRAKAKTPKSHRYRVHAKLAEKDTPEGRVQVTHTFSEAHAPGTKVKFPHKGAMKTGKVVRHIPGSTFEGSPSYVIYHGEYESAKVPAHKVELAETVVPKFETPVKDDQHYTGRINNKTYVVPHAFKDEGNGGLVPMRHAIVTALNHTIHNNPSLTPEEHAQVNAWIVTHHGEQQSKKLEEGRTIRGDVFSHHQTLIAKKTLRMPDAMVGVMGGPNKEEARAHLKSKGWTKKQIHDHEHYVQGKVMEDVEQVDEGIKGRMAHRRLFPAQSQWRFKSKLPSAKPSEHSAEQVKKNEEDKNKAGSNRDYDDGWSWTPKGHYMEEDTSTTNEPHSLSRTEFADWCGKSRDKAHSEKVHGFFKNHGWPEGHHYCTGSHHYAKTTGYDVIHHPNFKKKLQMEEMEQQDMQLDEQLHAYKVHHNGKHIDTIFYNYHEDPEDVKKSLVNHDGYHPNIRVTKERKKSPIDHRDVNLGDRAYKGFGVVKEAEQLQELSPATTNAAFQKRLMRGQASQIPMKTINRYAKKHVKGESAKRNEEDKKAAGSQRDYDDHYMESYHDGPYKMESVEQLDELSKGTLKRYIKQAASSATTASYMTAAAREHARNTARRKEYTSSAHFDQQADEYNKKSNRREQGIRRATDKLEESDTRKTIRDVLAEAFTRRHFKAIAELIKSHTDAKTRQSLADQHAPALAKDNPRFDHAKFHAAAGTTHKKD